MRKFLVAIVLGGFILSGLGMHYSYASEVDALLQKLVDKGVLKASDAQEIRTETNEEIAKQDKQKQEDYTKLAKDNMPDWVKNTKLKGDFRLRYQHDHAKRLPTTTTNPDKDRMRIRVRLGLESKVNDKLLVGLGLATGKNYVESADSYDSSRSPNVTLGKGFSKKPISLDYAYAQYSAAPWATIIGGRMKNPLWEPGDLIWDTDISPEGGVLKFTGKLNSKIEVFLNTGILVIDESTDGGKYASPTMYVAQQGLTYNMNGSVSLKGALSYYGFTGVKGKRLNGSQSTNTNATINGTANALVNNYENIAPALELNFKEPFKVLGVNLPYLSLFGEYANNLYVKHQNTGYMLGFKFGDEKIEKFGNWQFRYNYAMLSKDAILDILPDSDRYSGKTGIRGHEGMFDFGLGKNTWLGLDYYYCWQIPGNFASTQTKPASVFQLDWNMKF